MQENINSVLATVLKRVTPKQTEKAKMKTLAQKLVKRVVAASKEYGVKAAVRLEGSVAKGTWLSGERDLDVFMRVPASVPRESLGDICLKIARKATEGSTQVERFAEHPYLEAYVEGVRVNIVPCYAVKQGEWLSATDRTPYHTDYINRRLNPKMRGQVRLLKKFMKGIDVYGAEIKVGGFSGYLCELLILHYGSFLKTLEAFAEHTQRIIIDIERHYENRARELDLLFDEPLTIIDPVDKARNVASAVQTNKLYNFVAAAQSFLSYPSISYFYPPETKKLGENQTIDMLKRRGSDTVFVVFEGVNRVPDVLWGQLYKSQRSLRRLLVINDFIVLRDCAWSDEKDLNMFVFELEQCRLSSAMKHLGPPLDKKEESRKFVTKYFKNPNVISGPYVDDGRWVVLVRRKSPDARELLRDKLAEGGRTAGVAEGISHVLKRGFKVLVNEEIMGIYKNNCEFAVFLTEFLNGKPKWLEYPCQRESNQYYSK